MMELFHTILMRVTLAGIAGSVALTLSKDSALRETVRFAAGLMMILALLQPLTQLRLSELALGDARQDSTSVQTQNRQTARAAFEVSVADAIERRAAEKGFTCSVVVYMTEATGGTFAIERVQVTYDGLDAEQVTQLQTLLREECGIPPEQQEMIVNEKP